MSEVADFDRLEARLLLRGELVTRTALHIGSSGGEMDAMDLPVLRDAEGFPFIPGSSLKGVIRSTLEALVRAVEDRRRDPGLWACNPLGNRDEDAAKGCGVRVRGETRPIDYDAHCALCRLFGSQALASHVRMSDALLVDRAGPAPVEVRDGVAIDRDLRVVHGAQKYDFEVVSPGARFDVEVFVDNPRDWLMGLLAVGFDQLAAGFTALGGFTSRGLGRVTLGWKELEQLTAHGLLAGAPPTLLRGGDLDAEMDRWRRTLAARVGRDGHV